MANFPTWIKKTNSTTNNSNLSPRQVANKAYSLAIKKLDRDDKRRRPQYTVRERLLLSNTMIKAEDVLNKRTPRFNRRVLASENHNEDYAPPAKKMAISPSHAPIVEEPVKKIELVTEKESAEEKNVTLAVKELPKNQINESQLPTPEQIAVSIAVVAAAAAYTLREHCQQQQKQQSLCDLCGPILIPSHSLSSFATII